MSLSSLFKPTSIAVVGASRSRTKIGNIVLRNLMNTFTGRIAPVNNLTDMVEGVQCYARLTKIPFATELAVVTVPREAVPGVVDDAVSAGVKSVIVVTSGFKELDELGAKLEEELAATARRSGIRILGPNTLGIITPAFNATFSFSDVKAGGLALVSQSGGIGVYMLNWAHRTRTGLSYFVSLGNECDIKETEVYRYLADDEATKAIFSYNEGITDGRLFLEHVPEVASRKPIVFLKGGVGKKGAEAVRTHTGSLAGSSELFRAAVNTVGGIYIENLEEFLDLARLVLSGEPVKPRVLVVTNSGGHGVLATDEVERQGLTLAEIPDDKLVELRKVLPPQATAKNPLDLSGDADINRYASVLRIIEDLDCTKIVAVQSLPTISCSELAKVLLEHKNKSVMGVVMGLDEDAAARMLESGGIPAYRFPEDAVRSLRYMTAKSAPLRKIQNPAPDAALLHTLSDRSHIADFDAFRLLEAYGIACARWGTAMSAEEARAVADSIGYPVVMKISPDTPVHKTELGGVTTNVGAVEVGSVYEKLSRIAKRVLVQEQLSGVEVFVGGIDDPVFGKAVVVGLGGIYVEVFRTVDYGLCPVEAPEAADMLRRSRVLELLTARNGRYSTESVVGCITKVSRLMVDLDVRELDINPLIVNDKGAYAVDARILLK